VKKSRQKRFSDKWVSLVKTYGKKQDSGLHKHKLHQVLFVEKGVFLFEDENDRKVLLGDKIAYIPAATLHRAVSIGNQVVFHSFYFEREIDVVRKNRIQFFQGSALLRELIISLASNPKKSEIRSLSLDLLWKLLEKQIQRSKPTEISLPSSKEERNQKIIRFIDDHYKKKIRLEDFQNVLPLSIRQIDRIFQSELKISPMEYLRLKRIQMSVILLQASNLSIVEIALECGFESLSSYYSNFEEIMGTSPKKFQRGEKQE
jgi:AraC-like DNA-binding protein